MSIAHNRLAVTRYGHKVSGDICGMRRDSAWLSLKGYWISVSNQFWSEKSKSEIFYIGGRKYIINKEANATLEKCKRPWFSLDSKTKQPRDVFHRTMEREKKAIMIKLKNNVSALRRDCKRKWWTETEAKWLKIWFDVHAQQ